MIRSAMRGTAIAGVAALLAACGGGSSNGSSASGTGALGTPATQSSVTTNGSIALFIPSRTATSATSARKLQFVSPSASSLGVSVNGGTVAYSDVSATSTLCTAVNGGRNCTIPLTAAVGSDTFALTLFDGAAGAGTLLANGNGSTTATIGTAFALAVTLSPVVGSATNATFTFSSGTAFSVGAAGTATVAFTLLDPDGNVINTATTPSFATPLALTSSDAHVTIAPATWTGPSQAITLNYDGSTAVGNTVTIGVKAATATVGTAATMPTFHYVVSTLAGTGATGSADGAGASATFNGPYGLGVDTSGNIYVADTYNEKIRMVTPSGVVSTIAGSGGTGSADGPVASATFATPYGVAVDTAGNVYVTDHDNEKIRKISGGVVSTLAGTGVAGAQDGPGASATFSGPRGIITDASGNVYVSEIDNGGNKIRKITPAGVVSTIAGSGAIGAMNGPAASATFWGPSGVTIDSSGNLIIPDANNSLMRKISAGTVSTLAGTGATSPVVNGPGASATFNHPDGTALNSAGDILVADAYNNLVRLITPVGVVSTVAGSGANGSMDGIGANATFSTPIGVAIDAAGNIYVTDATSNKVRKITP
jgi:sugar lactone lactonase YvrE